MLSARRPAGLAVLAVVVACLAVGAVLWPQRTAHAARSSTGTTTARLAAATAGFAVVAHRGFPGPGVTENTLPAFRRAVRYGATAVELDVQLTRDGRFLVLHDPTLDRATTCRGRVDARTLASLQARCRGRRGHEHLPSLAEALDLVVRLHSHVVVDVKRPPSAWTPDRYRRLAATITSHAGAARTLVIGLHRANLEALRDVEPSLRVQGIADDLQEVARKRTWADGINLPAALATPELVRSLRDQGLVVLGRSTGRERDWTRLRRSGVDGLLTDRVASYRTWSPRTSRSAG